jgi:hypothetical protein
VGFNCQSLMSLSLLSLEDTPKLADCEKSGSIASWLKRKSGQDALLPSKSFAIRKSLKGSQKLSYVWSVFAGNLRRSWMIRVFIDLALDEVCTSRAGTLASPEKER